MYIIDMAVKMGDHEIQIIPYRKEDKPRIFSNYVRVVSSPQDITVQFADIKPPVSDEQVEEVKKNKIMKIPVDVEIVLPIEVAKSLLTVLSKQLSQLKVEKK